MKETFRDSSAGDQLSASEYNKLKEAVEKLANEGPLQGEGAGESNVGGMKGRGFRTQKIIMVRLLADVVPRNSAQYDYTLANNDPNEGFNAIVQVWDNDENEWTDSPAGERVTVTLNDDAQGWRPLVEDDRLPCVWSRDAQAYIPLEKRESAVVIITSGPDEGGYYLGNVVKWDSDAESWVTGNACYVIDVGSGGSSTSGFTGTVP